MNKVLKKTVSYIDINQPIGKMYLVKLSAKDIAEIVATDTRKAYNDNYIKDYKGIQRKLEIGRVNAISEYCQTENAMFPTPIILSAPSDKFLINEKEKEITISFEGVFCSVIDGQHRIEGIKKSGKIEKFELFVEFVFDTDSSRDAYLFSVINGNQKPVSKSLIYDLFGLSKAKTVEKVCNKVMRMLNTNENSMMNGKIKMLGYKDEFSPDGIVSQARLIDELIKHITDDKNKDNFDIEVGNYLRELKDEQYIFRKYFIQDEEETIINENIRFFNAWLNVAISERIKRKKEVSVLEKSLGFSAAYRLLKILYNFYPSDYEEKLQNIIIKFFEDKLDSITYSSSESGINYLFKTLLSVGVKIGVFHYNNLTGFVSRKQLEDIKSL